MMISEYLNGRIWQEHKRCLYVQNIWLRFRASPSGLWHHLIWIWTFRVIYCLLSSGLTLWGHIFFQVRTTQF